MGFDAVLDDIEEEWEVEVPELSYQEVKEEAEFALFASPPGTAFVMQDSEKIRIAIRTENGIDWSSAERRKSESPKIMKRI